MGGGGSANCDVVNVYPRNLGKYVNICEFKNMNMKEAYNENLLVSGQHIKN